MATYVNDLRLKEIATGDEAGTWGTSTNTNLELIGEALGYGSQNCFSSNANATTTVADGASDPARAMYFKVTSSATLTATRTLTIAPNTISRVMLIENATTGGQSIAISQGSGGNVTIPNGQTKMVYLDGAGSGAAVVDAFAALSAGAGSFTTLTASGDVNFDSGTLFVDASTNRVGIGTSSPADLLHVGVGISSVGDYQIISEGASGGYGAGISFQSPLTGGSLAEMGRITADGEAAWDTTAANQDAGLRFYTALDGVVSEKMRLNAKGNLGLDVAPADWVSGSTAVQVGSAGYTALSQATGGDSNLTNNAFLSGASTWTAIGSLGASRYQLDFGAHKWHTASTGTAGSTLSFTQSMTLTSGGNLGIGTTNPASLLTIQAAAPVFEIDSTTTTNTATIQFTTSGTVDSKITHVGNTGLMTIDSGRDASWGGSIAFVTDTEERMRIDSNGKVGIGTVPSYFVDAYRDANDNNPTLAIRNPNTGAAAASRLYMESNGNNFNIYNYGDGTSSANITEFYSSAGASQFVFSTNASEAMRIDSSGNLLVGKTSSDLTTNGFEVRPTGFVGVRTDGDPLYLNRKSTDGAIATFAQDGTTIGAIGASATSSLPYFAGSSGILVAPGGTFPCNGTGVPTDDTYDLGGASYRWDDVYATNGTIQTSDANEKQDVAELDEAERRVAVAAKSLLRKFRWKDSVAEKGDDARIHFGIIAQDLKAAFEAEGLDAGRYAMFIHSTWTDEETGEERSRMGVRYSELLAFIIAAL